MESGRRVSDLSRAYERSRNPLYVQVAAVMRQRIESGVWQPGQRIATFDELVDEFEVARVTVRQAVDLLRKEGLVDARQGRGTFVSHHSQPRHWLKLATDWAGALDQIRNNVQTRMNVEEAAEPPLLGPEEGSLAPEGYVFLRSVQVTDNQPYCTVGLHLAAGCYRRDPDAFRRSAALAVLAGMGDIRLARAKQTFVIGSADPYTADSLGIALGAPTAEQSTSRRSPIAATA